MRIERVPVHADARRLSRRTGRPALEHALMDGEDHELIATFPAAAWARLEGRGRRHAAPGNVAVTAIGRVEAGTGVYLPTDEAGSRAARWSGAGGWIHGA